MDNKPGIVIVSSSNIKPKSIIKLLAGKDAKIDETDPDKIHYIWNIDTKYYTSEVNVFGISKNYNRTEQFNENIHALIIHMDNNKINGLEDLKMWKNLYNECNAEVKLLLCNNLSTDNKISRAETIEWSLKNNFELIELYPNIDTESDQEIVKEKVGVDRIIEALQSYIWPNLVMKNDDYLSSKSVQKSEMIGVDVIDDFTELFSHLHLMKESIKGMPINQRKECAEQMVTAFWNAIGGDSDELEDLDTFLN